MAFIAPLITGSVVGTSTAAAATAASVGATAASVGGWGSILSAVGSAVGAVGALQSGRAQANAAEYNATMQQQMGAAEEQRRRTAADRQLGAIRAGIAKSGATSEGTPLMVLADSAANAEVDALNARWESQQRAGLSRMDARNARRGAAFRAGTSLLTGVGRLM